MTAHADALIDAFEDLLDRERALLLKGSVEGLGRLAEQKASLADHLGALKDAEGLERLRAKAERNAQLLDAAGAGIRSVTRRIAAVRAGPEPLSTYGANGKRASLERPNGSVERRA